MPNVEIAALFEEIGNALEIQNANSFRVRAYRNAARMLRAFGTEMADLLARGEDLRKLPAIGEDLAVWIRELVESGKCGALEDIRKGVPSIALELVKLPGIEPKKAHVLSQKLKLQTLDDLDQACLAHRVQDLPGFRKKAEDALRNSDGHRIEAFSNLRFGVMQARRGWLEKKNVVKAR